MSESSLESFLDGASFYPANNYFFKINNRNTRKGVRYVQI